MSPRLAGRRTVITGANRGLGLAMAERFLAEGADVALGARDVQLLSESADRLRALFPQRIIVAKELDVTSEASCTAFVASAAGRLGTIDVLINNAGVYGPMGSVEDADMVAWASAIQTNLMGSVLMVRAVLPAMKAARRGAIIQVSGGGATNPLPNMSAYAASKAAVVRFAETLAIEVEPYGVTVNSIAPGALNTRLLDEVLEAGPQKVGQDFYERSVQQRESGGVPLSKGSDLAVFLASDAARGVTGKLISAVWDRYEDWPAHLKELSGTDLYTLRRITGRDRGAPWGDA